MKILKQFLPLLILSIFLSGTFAQAQSKKEKDEKAKELKELQIEMYNKQIHKNKDLDRILKERKVIENEELKAILEDSRLLQDESMKKYRQSLEDFNINFKDAEHISIPEIGFRSWPESYNTIVTSLSGDFGESTVLNIRKQVEDLTFSSDFSYEVKEGSSSFQFKASGSVEDGTIEITLINPNDKEVHKFEISPLADVDWSQSLKWDEEKSTEHVGVWKIVVTADGATGKYTVSVRAN